MKFRLEIESDCSRLVLTPENKGEEQILLSMAPEKTNMGEATTRSATIMVETSGRAPYTTVTKLVIAV